MNTPQPLEPPPDKAAEKRSCRRSGRTTKTGPARLVGLEFHAVIIMLLLTFAVFSMRFPNLLKVDDPFFEASLNRAVRGLIGLVLIFCAYTTYQHFTIKRLRRGVLLRSLKKCWFLNAQVEVFDRIARIVDPLSGVIQPQRPRKAFRSGSFELAARQPRTNRGHFGLGPIQGH